MSKTHTLKTLKPFFQMQLDGKKPWEMRLNDRDFQVGDVIIQKEITLKPLVYTGREKRDVITYVFHCRTLFNIIDLVVMTIEPLPSGTLTESE